MSSAAEYDRLINRKWREAGLMDKPVDPDKAIRGCRALYRKAMGRPWDGPVELTSGNRYTSIRCGILIVNPNRPDHWGRTGWADMVHCMSHACHYRLRPRERPHSLHQTNLETLLTNYALSPAFAKYRGE